MKRSISLLILILFLGPFARAQAPAIETSLWLQSPNAKGAVLLLHGFNVRPSKMDTLAKSISSWGFNVYRPVLSGHGGILGDMQKTSPFYWVEETWRAIQQLAALTKAGTPIYFVGISMGGIILNQVLEKHPEARTLIKKLVLISPSFNFSFYSRSPGYLIFHDSYPLFMPDKEWDVDMVTLGTFKSLLDLYYEARETNFIHMKMPSLIFLHPKDKIIDAKGTVKLKENLKRSQWEIAWLPDIDPPAGNPNSHLLVDQNTAGPHVWRTLLDKTKEFLEK